MKRHAQAIGIAFLGGFGLLCLYWTGVTITRGEYLTTAVVLGCSVFCAGPIVVYCLNVLGKITPRVASEGSGTTIQPDRIVDVCAWVTLSAGVAAAAIFAFYWPRGDIDISVPHSQRYSMPFMSAVVVVLGARGLWQLASGKDRKYLRLTLQGFEFVYGSTSTQGQWSEITDVTDQAPGTSVPTLKSISVLTSDGETATMPVARTFGPNDGQTVRELIRFYWKHPDNRSELTDGRAIRRLQTEEFDRL